MLSSYLESLFRSQVQLPALVLAGFLLYRYLLYPAFFSPLAKIPTPHPLAGVLKFWLKSTERRGCQARSILKAHRAKGPILRVEPNHVHVASLDGLRVVFHVGRFDRTDYFLPFQNYGGTTNMLSMMDTKAHAVRRRIVSQIFSKSYILSSPDFQKLSHIIIHERLLPVFDEAAETGQGVDVFELSFAIAVEFLSAYQVGTAYNTDMVRKGTEAKRKAYLDAGREKLLEMEGAEKAGKVLEEQNLEMARKAEAFLEAGGTKDSESTTYPVVYALLRDAIPKKENPKSDHETMLLICSETLDNLEAARAAQGTGMTYMLHEIATRPAVQAALRAELMTLDPPFVHPAGPTCAITTATLRALDALPFLDAVIMETLRLRNPVLMLTRRVVPPGGAVIDGYFLPGGTEVSASTHTMHMNAEVFPKPEVWDPQRWVGLSKNPGEDRGDNDPRKWFWTFISGSRMCVGNNFAMLCEFGGSVEDELTFAAMKVVMAAIFTNYTAHVIDDEGIEQVDSMVARPVAEKLILGFKRVDKAEA
jgi:hypothetical protein